MIFQILPPTSSSSLPSAAAWHRESPRGLLLKCNMFCGHIFCGMRFSFFSPSPPLPFHTSAGVTEVTDHSDSNWMFDCCGGATSGRRGGRGKQTAFSSAPLVSPKITGISNECSHQLLALDVGIIILRSCNTPFDNNNPTLVKKRRWLALTSDRCILCFSCFLLGRRRETEVLPCDQIIFEFHRFTVFWRAVIIRSAPFMQNWMDCNAARFDQKWNLARR